MAEILTAGIFPVHGDVSIIREKVWQPPYFGTLDEKMKLAPRLEPLLAIFVERRVSMTFVGNPEIKWEDGRSIGPWRRRRLPQWLRNRIEDAIHETLRIAGGTRRGAETWYQNR